MLKGIKKPDFTLGALIPEGGTARLNKTGSWRADIIPFFSSRVCQGCPTPFNNCSALSEDCSVACQRDCLSCWISCPDGCILTEDGKVIGIDLDYCKGCGICASVCPRKAIEMREVKTMATKELA